MSVFLTMWTVYFSPPGLYGKYMARLWELDRDLADPDDPGSAIRATDKTIIGDTLDAVRQQLPPGLVPLARNAADDPSIVETWI
jgi:hypothetical protein